MVKAPFPSGKRFRVVDKDELFDNAGEYVNAPGVAFFDAWQEHSVPDVIMITDYKVYDGEDEVCHDVLYEHENGEVTESVIYMSGLQNLIEAGVIEDAGYE